MGLMLISFIILKKFSNPYIDMPSTQDILLIKVMFWYGVLFCAWNVIFFHWFIILIEKHMELLLENFLFEIWIFSRRRSWSWLFSFFQWNIPSFFIYKLTYFTDIVFNNNSDTQCMCFWNILPSVYLHASIVASTPPFIIFDRTYPTLIDPESICLCASVPLYFSSQGDKEYIIGHNFNTSRCIFKELFWRNTWVNYSFWFL